MDFSAIFTAPGLLLLGQIIIGDLTMAGDNVLIMGTIAGRLPERQRQRVLFLGVGMALVFLVTFATIATQLLKITGLVFAGGLLLLWVAYNMYREIRPAPEAGPIDDPDTAEIEGAPAKQTFCPGRNFARFRLSTLPSTCTSPASTMACAAPPEPTRPRALSS